MTNRKGIIAVLLMALVMCLPANSANTSLYQGGVVTSLSGVSATGAGDVFVLPEQEAQYTWTTTFTGTPTAITTNLEGSIDGTNFFTLDTSTSTTAEMRHVVNKPVAFLRCNIAVYTVNGSTATCKFKIVAARR